MNSNPSPGQGQQQTGSGDDPSQGRQQSGDDASASSSATADEGHSKDRGDNNRAPRQEPQAGRPPQRQQNDAASDSQPGLLDEDTDDIDTLPGADADAADTSRRT